MRRPSSWISALSSRPVNQASAPVSGMAKEGVQEDMRGVARHVHQWGVGGVGLRCSAPHAHEEAQDGQHQDGEANPDMQQGPEFVIDRPLIRPDRGRLRFEFDLVRAGAGRRVVHVSAAVDGAVGHRR